MNAEKTEVVLNVFNEKSTQPTHIEKYNKDDVSLDALWKIWKLEMEAQGFQVKECKPGEEELLLDLHGQTASTILPTYEALEVEAVKELEYYGYAAYLAADVHKANVLLRVYRAEYRNPDTGITGGRFGVIAYVKDRTGKYWVTKDCARKITIAKFMPNIEVPYSVSRGQNKVMIPADYKDFYIVVNKAAK